MWFKNIQLFMFTDDFVIDRHSLQQALSKAQFGPCLPNMAQSMGFVHPFLDEEGSELLFDSEGCLLFCLKIEKKLLPASVIKDHLLDAIKKLENTERRKIYKREREALKDEVYYSLLPRAFSRYQQIYAYFDLKLKALIVNTGAREQAEMFINFLRKQMNSLPLVPPEVGSPTRKLTRWLVGMDIPSAITVHDSCTLQNPRFEKSQIKIKQQDLATDTIQAFVRTEHFYVNQLALSYHDHLTCLMYRDFSFHQINYGESIQEMAHDVQTETREERFTADFLIMAQTVREFIQEMLHYFPIEEEVEDQALVNN